VADPFAGDDDESRNGQRHRRAKEVHVFELTPREMTVLELVAAGRTNREIAAQLFVSPRTVDVHVHHILAKLDAANRVEAAGIAFRHGIGMAG
jgi:DNA-binding NarL/FixJ family response regulator